MPIKYSVSYNVIRNECIASNGQIPERSDTSEYIKECYKGSVSFQYLDQARAYFRLNAEKFTKNVILDNCLET